MYKIQYDKLYNSIKVSVFAKINLVLNVGKAKNDGYHDIQTIYQTLDLHDDVVIKKNDSSFKLNHIDSIDDNERIEYKAYKEFFKYMNIPEFGIDVETIKNIPITGGLAGGSCDACAVIIALAYLSGIKIKKKDLYNIACKVGSDVPFILMNCPCMKGLGRGEILNKEKYFKTHHVLIILNPNMKISTKDAYSKLDLIDRQILDISDSVDALNNGNIDKFYKLMYNDFELLYNDEDTLVPLFKRMLIENKANASLLCGAGTNVFGLFKNKRDCNKAKKYIEEKGYKCIYTVTRGR